jgi:hypothetical protein
LYHPRLEHRAARAFFAGTSGHLPPSARDRAAGIGAQNSLLQRYLARKGAALPDEEHAAFAGETCRYRPLECVTALAWWSWAHPASERRAAVVAAIRSHQVMSVETRLDRVDRVARLFDSEPADRGDRDALLRAKQTTDLFYAHYHHAAPFSRSHLESVWRECESDPERREACGRARSRAEDFLGSLATTPAPSTATLAP